MNRKHLKGYFKNQYEYYLGYNKMNQPNQPPKSAEEVLREIVPTNCIWEDMGNLTNTPIEYVTEAMQTYASQFARYVPDEQIDAMFPETGEASVDYYLPLQIEAARQVRDLLQGKGGDGV